MLLFRLPAFTAACLWFGRPRGRGVLSSTRLSSITSWTCRTSAWRPSSLFFCLSDRGIGWPPSTFGRRISRFLFIRNLVASCALWLMAALTSSQCCASVCPRPHRSSLGLWLLCQLYFIPWVSVYVVTWTTGSSRPPHGRISSGSRGCLVPLSRVGDRRQPGEVQLLSVSGGPVSWGDHRRVDFYGFSIARSRLQAAVNRRRISALRRAPCQLVAVAAGDVVLSVTSGSMRSLQICLHRSWDRLNPSAPVAWSPDCLRDLRWWLHRDRLSRGVSLRQVSPDLDFWSDASDVGWGAHLGDRVVSGPWNQSESLLPVNARELLAVHRGLLHFQSFLSGTTVAVFCDNVTAVASLRSTPLRRRSSVGQNLFRFGWLPSSFRGSAMFSRTLSPVLISSPAPSGLSTWTCFNL